MGWGSGIAVSCGVGRRCSSDPKLWLWNRPATAASDLIPSLETSVWHGYNPKKQKKKKFLYISVFMYTFPHILVIVLEDGVPKF